MRPRRRFDTPPEREQRTRINEQIRVPQVRLIDENGEQIGVKATADALEYAFSVNLDLVEVAADARPPVCRVMDFSKYRYEQELKAKAARKNQSTIVIKEIKLRPKVADNDYQTKRGHVIRFLKARDKVKVTIMFRGRETTHPERGRSLLMRLAEDIKDIGIIESEPLQEGRNMTMMLAPVKLAAPVKTEADGGGTEAVPVDADEAIVAAALDSADADDAAVRDSADLAEVVVVDSADAGEAEILESGNTSEASASSVEETDAPESATA